MSNLRQHKRYTMRRTKRSARLRSAVSYFEYWLTRYNEWLDNAKAKAKAKAKSEAEAEAAARIDATNPAANPDKD